MNLVTGQHAAREYASRPPDERFPTMDALVENALHQKELSREVKYNFKDLAVVATSTGQDTTDEPSRGTLMLETPKARGRFTHWSFGQLCRSIGAPAGYLRSLPPAIAAEAMTYGLKATPVGEVCNLLVQAPNGSPEPTVRAATSEKYGRVWDAPLYDAVRQTITSKDPRWTTPPTWSGESAGLYRGDRDSFVILTNGGSIVKDPSLAGNLSGEKGGEMYRGILIRNSEVGAASVVIDQVLYRFICGNHMLWGAVIDRHFRRRHIGDTMRDVLSEINRVAWNWTNAGAARDEAIIKCLIDNEIAHTKEAVIDELRKIGASKDQAEQAYKACEEKESVSPRSFWGVAQGFTRASQEQTHQDGRYELDQLAAKVMARGAKLVRV